MLVYNFIATFFSQHFLFDLYTEFSFLNIDGVINQSLLGFLNAKHIRNFCKIPPADIENISWLENLFLFTCYTVEYLKIFPMREAWEWILSIRTVTSFRTLRWFSSRSVTIFFFTYFLAFPLKIILLKCSVL